MYILQVISTQGNDHYSSLHGHSSVCRFHIIKQKISEYHYIHTVCVYVCVCVCVCVCACLCVYIIICAHFNRVQLKVTVCTACVNAKESQHEKKVFVQLCVHMHSSDCVSVRACLSLTGQYHRPILAHHRYICYLTELIRNLFLFRNYNAERKRLLGQFIIISFPVYCLFNCKSSFFNTRSAVSLHFRDHCNKCGYIVRCINIGTLFSLVLVLLQKPSIGRALECVCVCACVCVLHQSRSSQ